MPRQCPDRSNLMNLRRNDAEIGTAVIFPHLGRGEGAGRGSFPNFPPRQRDKRSDLSTVPASLVSAGTSVSIRDTRLGKRVCPEYTSGSDAVPRGGSRRGAAGCFRMTGILRLAHGHELPQVNEGSLGRRHILARCTDGPALFLLPRRTNSRPRTRAHRSPADGSGDEVCTQDTRDSPEMCPEPTL